MLNLNAFRSTTRRVTVDQAVEEVGDEMFHDFENAAAVWLFDGLLFVIERTDGTFWTLVGRGDKAGTFDEVSEFLYLEGYVPEIEDDI